MTTVGVGIHGHYHSRHKRVGTFWAYSLYDSTNLERDALRNRIRLDVLPMLERINPQVGESLSSLCSVLQGSLPYYHEGIQTSMRNRGITPNEFGREWLSDRPEMNVLLHEWLRPMHFNAAQQAEMLSAATATSGRIWESDTHKVLLDRKALVAERKDTENKSPIIRNADSIKEG